MLAHKNTQWQLKHGNIHWAIQTWWDRVRHTQLRHHNSPSVMIHIFWQLIHGNIHRTHYKNSNVTIFTLWHMKCPFIHTLNEMGHRDTFCDNLNMLTQGKGETHSQNEIHVKTMSKQNNSSALIQKWWTERANTNILSNPWTCQWPNDTWMTRRNTLRHDAPQNRDTVTLMHRYTAIATPSLTDTYWPITPPSPLTPWSLYPTNSKKKQVSSMRMELKRSREREGIIYKPDRTLEGKWK